jgi:hypothetical protein
MKEQKKALIDRYGKARKAQELQPWDMRASRGL